MQLSAIIRTGEVETARFVGGWFHDDLPVVFPLQFRVAAKTLHVSFVECLTGLNRFSLWIVPNHSISMACSRNSESILAEGMIA